MHCGLCPRPPQCTLDPDTAEPTDKLTEQAIEFCQQVGSQATTVSEIVSTKDSAVHQAIEEGIRRVNAKAAARPYHIQKWAILHRDFSISGEELGRFPLCLSGEAMGDLWQFWRELSPWRDLKGNIMYSP